MSKNLLNLKDLENVIGGKIYVFVREEGAYISNGINQVIIPVFEYNARKMLGYSDERIINKFISLAPLKDSVRVYKNIADFAKSLKDNGRATRNIYRYINTQKIGLVI